MKINSISAISFQAGSIELKNFSKEDLTNYNVMKKIAETEKVDFTIRKSKQNKYISKHDLFIVIARKAFQEPVHSLYGLGVAIIDKHSNKQQFANKLNEAFFSSLNKLKTNIVKFQLENPNILKEIIEPAEIVKKVEKPSLWSRFVNLFK